MSNKRLLTSSLILYILTCIQPVFGQNGVKIAATSGTADPSAMLDVSSTSQGVLIPRMIASQRTAISSPAAGLLVFQTDGTPGFYYNAGTPATPNWTILSAGALSGTGTTNYISKWTASNVLGNSIVFDNGTNVGIGTPSPGYKVDIQGGSLNVGALYGTSVVYATLGSYDTRATNPNPETYNMGVVAEFKSNGANGLNDGGGFNSVLSVRDWSSSTDWSGGGVSQLAFTQNGNIYHRYSQTTGTWGAWYKLSDTRTTVFNASGADQTYTVPAGVTSITVKMWGAGGGGGSRGGWTYSFAAGGGGYTTGTIAVTPGSVYYVVVGLGGGPGSQANNAEFYGGGGKSCGGGTDCQYSGTGGGRSAFRNTANSADLMTAGGGGGGGTNNAQGTNASNRGGAGGGNTGQTGECIQTPADAGGGGTQSAGGVAGTGGSELGLVGTQYHGGAGPGGGATQGYSAGGGGGWYGGGSGSYSGNNMGGGGGGSGYIGGAGVSGATTTQGTFQYPPNMGDPNYLPGVGFGGSSYCYGGNGLVIITTN